MGGGFCVLHCGDSGMRGPDALDQVMETDANPLNWMMRSDGWFVLTHPGQFKKSPIL
jgi:hypothetical protein